MLIFFFEKNNATCQLLITRYFYFHHTLVQWSQYIIKSLSHAFDTKTITYLKFTIRKLYRDQKPLLYHLYKLVEAKEIRNKTFKSCNVSSNFITSINVNFVGCKAPRGTSPHALSKLIYELVPRVFKLSFLIY